MSLMENLESTDSWEATPLTSWVSVMGLDRPFLATAVASTRRNSWSRRIRARSLEFSNGQ